MQVGFAVLVSDQQAEIQFLGRGPADSRCLVGHARQGGQHAVLMGRLTYRAELADQLGLEASEAVLSDDAALALAAYQRWGSDGLARLEGSFALVVWDADEKLLLGTRDPLGGYPLFWTRHPSGLAIGTCMGPLLPLLPRRSLNLGHLAEFLTMPSALFHEVGTEHSVYEGVYRVRPGAIIQARMPAGQVQEKTHWNWLEKIVDPGTDRLEELGDLVGDSLRRAVGEQMRGRVAAHVSGGMDSTAVALLARDWLQGQPGQPPVHAISLLFDKLGGMDRETPYVEVALGQPGLVPHRVAGDDILDYDSFADAPPHDEPFSMLGRFRLLAKLVEPAASVGARTLLTGTAAEATTDQRPFYLADLLRRGQLRSAWRIASAWGLANSRSAWSYLWFYGVRSLLPTALARRHKNTTASWIRPEFVRSHALGDRARRQQQPTSASANLAQILLTLRAAQGDAVNWYAAAPQGVTIVHPFLDARFVRLGLGIQGRFRQEPGTQKPLLARAMRDVLPEAILNRRIKGRYNALIHSGLARNLPMLEALVHQAPVEDLGVFDKNVLLKSLRHAALGFLPPGLLEQLDLTLAWLKWHSLQAEGQRPTAPAAIFRFPTHDRSPEGRAAGRRPVGVNSD